MQRDRLLTGAVVVMGLAAVLTTAFAVRGRLAGASSDADVQPRRVSGWERYVEPGSRIGPERAAVTVVEFSDFQCVFCKQHAAHLDRLRQRYPGQLAVVFRHFPVTERHPHAYAAALAAECAREQGEFDAMRRALFRHQEAIGKSPWLPFATAAGVRDTADFRLCMETDRHAQRIAADLEAGRKLGVPATPTSLINGMKVVGAVEEQVAAAVRNALSDAGAASP